MNYYVVSEEELERLKVASFQEAVDQLEGNELTDELEDAKAAARVRPVPEWARLLVDAFPDASKVEEIGL